MAAPIGNKNAEGNEGGRPLIFETTEDCKNKCNAYFEYIKGESHKEQSTIFDKDGIPHEIITDVWDRLPEPGTITGLTLFLGFNSRSSLYNYENKIEFLDIIKNAMLRVENEYEKALRLDKTPTGSIFALKNMGWKDQSNVEHSGEIKTTPQIKLTQEQIDKFVNDL